MIMKNNLDFSIVFYLILIILYIIFFIYITCFLFVIYYFYKKSIIGFINFFLDVLLIFLYIIYNYFKRGLFVIVTYSQNNIDLTKNINKNIINKYDVMLLCFKYFYMILMLVISIFFISIINVLLFSMKFFLDIKHFQVNDIKFNLSKIMFIFFMLNIILLINIKPIYLLFLLLLLLILYSYFLIDKNKKIPISFFIVYNIYKIIVDFFEFTLNKHNELSLYIGKFEDKKK